MPFQKYYVFLVFSCVCRTRHAVLIAGHPVVSLLFVTIYPSLSFLTSISLPIATHPFTCLLILMFILYEYNVFLVGSKIWCASVLIAVPNFFCPIETAVTRWSVMFLLNNLNLYLWQLRIVIDKSAADSVNLYSLIHCSMLSVCNTYPRPYQS